MYGLTGAQGLTGAAGAEAYRWFNIAGTTLGTLDQFIDRRSAFVAAQEIRSQRQILRATTLTALRVFFTVPYTAATATIALRKAGADTALVGTIAPGASTLLVTGSIAVAALDALAIRITLSSAEANAGLGVSVVVY